MTVLTLALQRQSKLTTRSITVLETESSPTEPEGLVKVSVIVSTSCPRKDVTVRGIKRGRHELKILMPTARLEPWSPEVLPVQVRRAPTEPEGLVKVLVMVSTSCSPKNVQVRCVERDRHELK